MSRPRAGPGRSAEHLYDPLFNGQGVEVYVSRTYVLPPRKNCTVALTKHNARYVVICRDYKRKPSNGFEPLTPSLPSGPEPDTGTGGDASEPDQSTDPAA